ncbi:MAG: tryptophan--tRNA ligase [Candidatus Improbicoccus pseudotrichonymphae]|uniref:Tryptophan--tRNA ligase n=1 Tax=Candidatus Improbicoccus pseudotrichonymphae TaxID=3033792 RepID=A0AA48L0W4_9FIRM|nr:MAG: tryptophan--tRNA ligase [Candidatus Improbicoccus pseudotrichonymphae]
MIKIKIAERDKIILTGDRPTGKLHLGHYIGSLKKRVEMQDEYRQYVLIADVQALTDNAENPQKIRDNIIELILDYLSVGIDPQKTVICIQSMIPAIAELTVFYLNLVTVARLERNPTVRQELKSKNFTKGIPAGFLIYPVSQAADITSFGAHFVPAGEDQSPLIEQTCEIVKKFNSTYENVLIEPKIILSKTPRLIGIDGKNKMSKSLNNAIFLSDTPCEIEKKVMCMFTDPNHLSINDAGNTENNPVFIYLDVFGKDREKIGFMKKKYQKGGLGDVETKKYLNNVIQDFLLPIREKRDMLKVKGREIYTIALEGTEKAKLVTSKVLEKVKSAMKIDYDF